MMRSRSAVLLPIVIVTMTLFSGCWPRRADRRMAAREHLMQERIAAAEQAIRTASSEWAKVAQAKDLDKSVSYYTDDAIFFGPKAPAIYGKENIRKAWQQFLAAPGPGLSLTTAGVEVSRSADLAWERGSYEVATIDKNGKTSTETGKFVLIWKQQADGAWKVVADLNAADQ